MNLYIFQGAERVSTRYHQHGSLAIVAESISQAIHWAERQLICSDDDHAPGSEIVHEDGCYPLIGDRATVHIYPLADDHDLPDQIAPARFLTFPDAGCC